MRKVMISIIALLAVLTLVAIGLNLNQHESIPSFFSQMVNS